MVTNTQFFYGYSSNSVSQSSLNSASGNSKTSNSTQYGGFFYTFIRKT